MKLCRKIIFASIAVISAFFLISLSFEILKAFYPSAFDTSGVGFAQTWISGIACSLIVVVFTTYIQHQFEETDVWISLGVELFFLLSKYISLEKIYPENCEKAEGFDLDAINKEFTEYMNTLKNDVDDCLTKTYNFAPLTTKKKKIINALSDYIEELSDTFLLNYTEKTPFELYLLLRDGRYFVNLAESTVHFYERKSFEHFKKQLNKWLEAKGTQK